ncbi:PQQ-binding-like beta-propeller repeat protein [Saccharibacillus sp. CPCC 101409]|uniref:outer membrane protein assembly factor BamB family protein n=1 Tax=Saccharibacillus sp. CPCC 101409 TaxID=3058041 RepID=UPI002673CBBC|nr:PQQ-binding-like beta-propeller repeat protein [Saccharibacillus sp. CPCC 101409]MDO3412246.1 PQQ-binding-like beta-propeller repeat protein [Saccharibacillus sp. CPCC 101409]
MSIIKQTGSSIRKLAAAVLAVSLLLPAAGGAQRVLAEQSSVTAKSVYLKPDWEKTVRKIEYGAGPEIGTYANGRVFYKLGQTLTAADVKTGKALWSCAAEPGAAPIADGSGVYFVDVQGYAYKLNPSTGKRIWKSAASLNGKNGMYSAYNIGLQSGLLIVGDSGNLSAFDTATGTLKWKTPAGKTYGYRLQEGGGNTVLAVQVMLDPYLAGSKPKQLYAFDAQTGKRLWSTKSIYQEIVTVQDGYAYAKVFATEDEEYRLNIDKIDLSNAKAIETFRYIPHEKGYGEEGGSSAAYYDGKFYISYLIDYQKRQWGLARIPLGAPSGAKPESTLSFPTPIYQVTPSKDYIAVALMTKQVYLINRQTNKIAASSTFTSNFFNLTLDADTHFLVQTAGKISAIKKPAPVKE